MFPFKKSLLFIICFSFLSNLFSQEFLLPNDPIKGEVSKVYEATSQVFKRTNIWEFQDKKFATGKVISYDLNGQYKAINYYYTYKSTFNNIAFTADNEGNLTSGKIMGFNNELAVEIDFEYQTSGQLKELAFKKVPEQNLIKRYEYKYKDGQLKETRLSEWSRDTFELTTIFEKGVAQETIKKNENGELDYKIVFVNNSNGLPEKSEYFDADGTFINRQTFVYQYDEKGNWVKRLMTDEAKDSRELTSRIIVYKEEYNKKKISKANLEGIWMGWGNGIMIEFRDGKSNVYLMEEKKDYDDDFTYNPYSGELSMKLSFMTRRFNYLTEYNGKVLSIHNQDIDWSYHLKKVNLSEVPSNMKRKFLYQKNKMPQVESFEIGGKYGMKNSAGKTIVPAEFESVIAITRQVIKVSKDNKFGLYDYNGKKLTDVIYDKITLRELGYLRFTKDGKAGLLDPYGKEIIPANYRNIAVTNSGFVLITDGRREGILSLGNEEILPMVYKDFRKFQFNRAFAYRGGGGSNGWINEQYELIKEFDQYGQVYPIDANCFKMEGMNGWGLLDSLGNELIEPQFEKISRGNAQLAVAEKNEKYALINSKGEQITEFIYDRVVPAYLDDFDQGINFNLIRSQAAAFYIRGQKWGYINGLGKEVEPKVSPMVQNSRFFKKEEIPGIMNIHYPSSWKKQAGQIYKNDKDALPRLKHGVIGYEGDPAQFIQGQTGYSDWEREIIAGKPAFSRLRVDRGGYNNNFVHQEIYIVVNESEMILLNTSCKEHPFPKYAQEFHNIIQSLEIFK